jgi:hypothetical protein
VWVSKWYRKSVFRTTTGPHYYRDFRTSTRVNSNFYSLSSSVVYMDRQVKLDNALTPHDRVMFFSF